MDLNICSRREMQTAFSGEKYIGGINMGCLSICYRYCCYRIASELMLPVSK